MKIPHPKYVGPQHVAASPGSEGQKNDSNITHHPCSQLHPLKSVKPYVFDSSCSPPAPPSHQIYLTLGLSPISVPSSTTVGPSALLLAQRRVGRKRGRKAPNKRNEEPPQVGPERGSSLQSLLHFFGFKLVHGLHFAPPRF